MWTAVYVCACGDEVKSALIGVEFVMKGMKSIWAWAFSAFAFVDTQCSILSMEALLSSELSLPREIRDS